jgi:hypothetical protein
MGTTRMQEKLTNDNILERKKYKRHRVDVDETIFKCRGLMSF